MLYESGYAVFFGVFFFFVCFTTSGELQHPPPPYTRPSRKSGDVDANAGFHCVKQKAEAVISIRRQEGQAIYTQGGTNLYQGEDKSRTGQEGRKTFGKHREIRVGDIAVKGGGEI